MLLSLTSFTKHNTAIAFLSFTFRGVGSLIIDSLARLIHKRFSGILLISLLALALLTVFLPPPGMLLDNLVEGGPFVLELDVHFLPDLGEHVHQMLREVLHDMEAVNRNAGVGECRACDEPHRVGEVHADVNYRIAGILGQLPQPLQHRLGLDPADDGDDGPLSAAGVLVRHKGVQLAAVHAVVYRQVQPHVLSQQDPLPRMLLLLPCPVVAQEVPVYLPEIVARHAMAAGYVAAGDGTAVKLLLLKKQQTLGRCWCHWLSGGICTGRCSCHQGRCNGGDACGASAGGCAQGSPAHSCIQ
mgnify:CR=1 FL=1